MSNSKSKKGAILLGRRRLLQITGTSLGSVLLPSNLASDEDKNGQSSYSEPKKTKSAARFFTPQELVLIEELAETVIPADSHSGGAKAAKVADYIEQVIRESIS